MNAQFTRIYGIFFALILPLSGLEKLCAYPPQNCIDLLNRKIGSMSPIFEDISYLIADLKFDGEQIKICEFGEGTRSRFKGYDYMVGKGIIWKDFWNILEEHQFPKWYIDKQIPFQLHEKSALAEEIALNYFLSNKGQVATSADTLVRGRSLDRLKCKSTPATPQQELACGLLMFRHVDASSPAIENLRKKHTNILVLNAATAPFVNNKYTTDALFQENDLRRFRPQAMLCQRLYTPTLADSIKKNIPAAKYVIKPLNAFKGCGVIMVEKEHLNTTLKQILEPNKKLLQKDFTVYYNGYSYTDRTLSYWAQYKEPYFIIEEMCYSKTLEVNGKRYDPTMRVAFVLRYFNNKVKINYLAAYWKLPLKHLDEEGSETEKHKSVGIIPIPTTAEEQERTFHALNRLLPTLYTKMITTINNRTLLSPREGGEGLGDISKPSPLITT